MARRTPSPKSKRSRSQFRSTLQHECLEQRHLFAVTSRLLDGGILDIQMDADRDSAEVRVDRNQLSSPAMFATPLTWLRFVPSR